MALPTIYFLRHGETDWNAMGRLQGRLDIPLNAKGREQAKRNGGLLAELVESPLEVRFVASPLTRTRQTMRIAREAMGLPEEEFIHDERLAEISFGDWEGKTWAEVKAEAPEAYEDRARAGYAYRVPNGESYADVMERVISFLEDVREPTVVVSHGGIMRCLRGHIMGLPGHELMKLQVPQDRVMLVEAGTIRLL